DELQRRACGRYRPACITVIDEHLDALCSRIDASGQSHRERPPSKKELALPFRWQKKGRPLETLDCICCPDTCPVIARTLTSPSRKSLLQRRISLGTIS